MHFRPRCVWCGLFTRFVWWIMRGRLMAFDWIAREWLFCSCGIAWKNMMEMGRGGACVPARVALQGRFHRSFPRGMMTPKCVWWMICSKS